MVKVPMDAKCVPNAKVQCACFCKHNLPKSVESMLYLGSQLSAMPLNQQE
jgi:hypothetical protein